MNIRTLSGLPVTLIHQAFVDAFSDYEVQMEMPLHKLEDMMNIRSYSPELSVGCFPADEPVPAGFALTGFRLIDGEPSGYDIATGVGTGRQGQGIGGRLMDALMQTLAGAGVRRFQLEVLQNNTAAQKLYLNQGFEVTRELCCYQMPASAAGEPGLPGDCRLISGNDALVQLKAMAEAFGEASLLSYTPSWQNALASFEAVPHHYEVHVLEHQGEPAAYGILHVRNGSVLQIGLAPHHAHSGFEQVLLQVLGRAAGPDVLQILNVEKDSRLDLVLRAMNLENIVNQFEMFKRFRADS